MSEAFARMTMRLPILLLVPVLAAASVLAGCGRHTAPVAGPPSHEVLNAGGEPQWSAQLREGRLTFTDGGDFALSGQAARGNGASGEAVWTAPVGPTVAGRPQPLLRLTASRKPCRDAETGMTYPLSAAVEVYGRRYLGCAAAPGQGLGPRQ